MFTGIVEATGTVRDMISIQTNLEMYIDSPISHELKIDQSVSHNGACLTITETGDGWHRCTLIKETMDKTNFSQSKKGDVINLERCLKNDSRIDGHFVQGHIDTTSTITDVQNQHGSWTYTIELANAYKSLIVSKGSICINGISLTVSALLENHFQVSIIPYTFDHTNARHLRTGDLVNIEFDIFGKYVSRMISLQAPTYFTPR
jgi:riboflavin synthase